LGAAFLAVFLAAFLGAAFLVTFLATFLAALGAAAFFATLLAAAFAIKDKVRICNHPGLLQQPPNYYLSSSSIPAASPATAGQEKHARMLAHTWA
jgi:hypothetical protein